MDWSRTRCAVCSATHATSWRRPSSRTGPAATSCSVSRPRWAPTPTSRSGWPARRVRHRGRVLGARSGPREVEAQGVVAPVAGVPEPHATVRDSEQLPRVHRRPFPPAASRRCSATGPRVRDARQRDDHVEHRERDHRGDWSNCVIADRARHERRVRPAPIHHRQQPAVRAPWPVRMVEGRSRFCERPGVPAQAEPDVGCPMTSTARPTRGRDRSISPFASSGASGGFGWLASSDRGPGAAKSWSGCRDGLPLSVGIPAGRL